jgi:hypothetical protein
MKNLIRCWNYPHGEIAEIVDKGATVEIGEDIVAFILVTLKETVEKLKRKLLISK